MDKQKAAEQMVHETFQLIQEMGVVADKQGTETKYALDEDKSDFATNVARFKTLEDKGAVIYRKLKDVNSNTLEQSYDDIVEAHKIVSEQRSILRTLTGV